MDIFSGLQNNIKIHTKSNVFFYLNIVFNNKIYVEQIHCVVSHGMLCTELSVTPYSVFVHKNAGVVLFSLLSREWKYSV